MLLIPALGKRRQADLNEFEAGLVYTRRSRPAKATNKQTKLNKK